MKMKFIGSCTGTCGRAQKRPPATMISPNIPISNMTHRIYRKVDRNVVVSFPVFPIYFGYSHTIAISTRKREKNFYFLLCILSK